MTYTFDCSPLWIPSSPAFPDAHVIKVPLLEATLIHGTNRFPCIVRLDTGCDYAQFPKSFAARANLDLREAPSAMTLAMGTPSETVYHTIEVEIASLQFKETMMAGFTQSDLEFGLLGLAGFFDRIISVTFDYPNGKFSIEVP